MRETAFRNSPKIRFYKNSGLLRSFRQRSALRSAVSQKSRMRGGDKPERKYALSVPVAVFFQIFGEYGSLIRHRPILFVYDVQTRFYRGGERDKAQVAVFGEIDESVQADRAAQSRADEMGGVVQQIVSRGDIQLFRRRSHPRGYQSFGKGLFRADKRSSFEIPRSDGGQRGKIAVFAHERAPPVFQRQRNALERRRVGISKDVNDPMRAVVQVKGGKDRQLKCGDYTEFLDRGYQVFLYAPKLLIDNCKPKNIICIDSNDLKDFYYKYKNILPSSITKWEKIIN